VPGNTLVVGNAAGLASPLHGGGIDTACIFGILAAQAVSEGDPGLYWQSLETFLAARLDLEQKMLNLWEKLSFDELNGLLTLVFDKQFRRFACLLKYRALWPEILALRSLAGGYLRADWQKALPPGCLVANSVNVTAVPEKEKKACLK
jgi:digeranylgeranylglycerophospholipid reductase